MTEYCPYYFLPGSKIKHVIVGSDHCLARKHPMCGFKDICPGDSAVKAAKTAEPEASASEADEGLSWADLASEMAEPAEAEAAEAEPGDLAETPARSEPAADESLGEALRRLRNEKGFTLKSLGLSAELSPVNISKWENGNHRPGQEALLKLDSIFGSDLLERFGGGLRGSGGRARVTRKKKPAVIEPVPAVAIQEPAADRVRPASAPPMTTPPPAGGRDDFIREILYQAARAREDFNAIIHAALEAAKVSRKEKSDD